MKQIKLHGDLATKFGEDWKLDVRNPGEAIRAIEANRPGFIQHILNSDKQGVGYRVVVGDRPLALEEVPAPFGQETLHIVPVIGGAKSGGAMILLGAALIAISGGSAAILTTTLIEGATVGVGAMTLGGVAFTVGVSLVLGGVSQMLMKVPQAPSAQDVQEDLPSHFFNGPVNTGRQGSAIPVGYGTLLIGGIPISAGFTTENMI